MQAGASGRRLCNAMEPHGIRHVRPVRPVRFPASDPEWEMSESTRHGRMCELLYQLLRAAVGPQHTVGKDNFVYFDASNARRKCAPDGFVKVDLPQAHFDSYKTWGTPAIRVACQHRPPGCRPRYGNRPAHA